MCPSMYLYERPRAVYLRAVYFCYDYDILLYNKIVLFEDEKCVQIRRSGSVTAC